jgi:hypothetical protein
LKVIDRKKTKKSSFEFNQNFNEKRLYILPNNFSIFNITNAISLRGHSKDILYVEIGGEGLEI